MRRHKEETLFVWSGVVDGALLLTSCELRACGDLKIRWCIFNNPVAVLVHCPKSGLQVTVQYYLESRVLSPLATCCMVQL